MAHADLAGLMRSQVGSEVVPKDGPITEHLGVSGSFEPIRLENLGSFMQKISTFQKIKTYDVLQSAPRFFNT